MSGARRRAAMVGVVIAVALWPVVHLALVARADIDPWELFGWAMYARPEARVQVGVEVERAGVRTPLRAMGSLRRQVERYARDRSALGRLAPADALLTAVFASDASIDAIEIVLRHVELDPDSAMLVARLEPMRFERPQPLP